MRTASVHVLSTYTVAWFPVVVDILFNVGLKLMMVIINNSTTTYIAV